MLCRRLHTEGSLEEWYIPGSRPDGLAHRTVQYAAASPGTLAAANSRPTSALGAARPSAHRHRSSVATGSAAEAEREIACVREQFSQQGALLERSFDMAEGQLTLSVPAAGGTMLTRTYGEPAHCPAC